MPLRRIGLPLLVLAFVTVPGNPTTDVNEFYPLDADPGRGDSDDPLNLLCSSICDEFSNDGIYHLRQVGDIAESQLYCDMTGGRWNVLLRRGFTADNALVAERDQLRFEVSTSALELDRGAQAALSQNMLKLYGNLTGEFFIGMEAMNQLTGSYHMMVDMETASGERFFSIFESVSFPSATITPGDYVMGTAGDGNMQSLSGMSLIVGHVASTTVNGVLLMAEPRPLLGKPLDGLASEPYHWPTLKQPIRKISVKIRSMNAKFCTRAERMGEHLFAFHPDDLRRFRINLQSSMAPAGHGLSDNVTIDCKTASLVTPTVTQYDNTNYGEMPSKVTFKCIESSTSWNSAGVDFDDVPLSKELICMTPCKRDYTLVAPAELKSGWSGDTTVVRRATCLSPVLEPAGLGPVEAAKLCADRDEQLLDFPVGADRIANPDEHKLLLAMQYRKVDLKEVLTDLRGNVFSSFFRTSTWGSGNVTLRCVGIHSWNPSDTIFLEPMPCYDENLFFACMSITGCAKGLYYERGFCYQLKTSATPLDHTQICYPDPTGLHATLGMPAEVTQDMLNSPGWDDVTPNSKILVGAYRRRDGFFTMGDRLEDSVFEGGVVTDTGGDCAVLDSSSLKLSQVACNDITVYQVLCQYPGLPVNECPTVWTSTGEQLSGVADINSDGRLVNRISSEGTNYFTRKGPHELEYECKGLIRDWELLTPLPDDVTDVSVMSPPSVSACAVDEVSLPANSNSSVHGITLVHNCLDALQTANGDREQRQRCDHIAYAYQPADPLLPCDICLADPFVPDEYFTATSNWDSSDRFLQHQVNFTCLPGLTTTAGATEQVQTCTVRGWEGEVEQCSRCIWDDSWNSTLFNTTSSGQGYGQLVEIACAAGMQNWDDSLRNSAVCTPDGWNTCNDDFTCSQCQGEPTTRPRSLWSNDWTGAQVLGTVVTFKCDPNMITLLGNRTQRQRCTDSGWTGVVRSCKACDADPVDVDNLPAVTRAWNGSRLLNTTAYYSCNEGTVTASGHWEQVQTCWRGWQGEVIPCDVCVGDPASVTGMVTISSDWAGVQLGNWTGRDASMATEDAPTTDGSSTSMTGSWTVGRTMATVITYTCQGSLTTAAGRHTQHVNCSLHGWIGTVLPCDTCGPPPSGNHSSIWSARLSPDATRAGGLLGSSVVYRCRRGLSTLDGQDHIVTSCELSGWTRCEMDIVCNYCDPLPDVSRWGGTLTWDYQGANQGANQDANQLDSVVTLTCEPGLATPTLNTTQTLLCGRDGWNVSEVRPCGVCTDPAPAPAAMMESNSSWVLGDLTANYTCLDKKQLPWGRNSYEITCSPSGWSCVPECDWCADPPAAPPGSYKESHLGSHGGKAVYPCLSNRTTSTLVSSQQLTCNPTGWDGELLPCDMCAGNVSEPSASQNRTWTGNGTVGAVATFQCFDNMQTRSNATRQTQNCTEVGWTTPPEPCDLCLLPPDGYKWISRSWDGNRTVSSTAVYSCAANLTTMSDQAVQTLTCTENGWDRELERCAACRTDIPLADNTTVVAWSGDRHPGTKVRYTCQYGAVQHVTCEHARWQPDPLPECVRPTELPPGEITFPPLPPYDPRYHATTNYYWGTINFNMTEETGDGFEIGDGPLGFDTSLKLDGTGCVAQKGWASKLDSCAINPANCEEGFSFSLWARVELGDSSAMFEENVTSSSVQSRQYLLSTGGDVNGHPGIAIYKEGLTLSALVSTGAEYWLTTVKGFVKNNTWNNIGVRWSKQPFDNSDYGGIQLYINNSTEGHTVIAQPSEAPAKAGLDPGEIMVGCHRTASSPTYRDKCPCEFDEVAMWTRPLPSNETMFFLGGFDSADQELDMESLRKMFSKCSQCMVQPDQFKAFISKVLVQAKTAPAAADPTVPSTAAAAADSEAAAAASDDLTSVELPSGIPVASPEKVNKIRSLATLIYDMTGSCKNPMGKDELTAFLELGVLLGETMELKTLSQWKSVEYTTKEDGGAATVISRIESWALMCAKHIPMEPKDKVHVSKRFPNVLLQIDKMKTFNLRQKPKLRYPKDGDSDLNTITIATDLFHKSDECLFIDVSIEFMNYETYGLISPKRANLLNLDVNDEDLVEIDGNVLTLKYVLNGAADGSQDSVVSNCTPSAEQLRRYPLQVAISHSSGRKALRKAMFHQEEINTGILRRLCVWWNAELSDYGSWDTDGCRAVESTDYYTKCACKHFGQFAIMIEKVPPKLVDLEYSWLKITKYVCYTISAILLILFIVVVIKMKQLHEMFHLMRLQTAAGILVGSIFMCLTDMPEIRADRHTCTAFAATIHFFYLLAGTMVMLEGIADFLSVTNGTIGGKLKSYTALAWGVPFVCLGYAFFMYLHDYGTDPRCMLGWPNVVKMTMFLPLVVMLIGAFLMTCLLSCNMQASRLRKENIVAEQLTVCKGFVFFSFYFIATWIVGMIAYIRHGASIPSFYPLFQILNSTGGIVFFLFCGMGSERFRLLVTGKGTLRKNLLFSYTVTEQLSEKQQQLVVEEPSRQDTPDQEEKAPFDPNAAGPRGPLVA